jgi:hypothetical protein
MKIAAKDLKALYSLIYEIDHFLTAKQDSSLTKGTALPIHCPC